LSDAIETHKNELKKFTQFLNKDILSAIIQMVSEYREASRKDLSLRKESYYKYLLDKGVPQTLVKDILMIPKTLGAEVFGVSAGASDIRNSINKFLENVLSLNLEIKKNPKTGSYEIEDAEQLLPKGRPASDQLKSRIAMDATEEPAATPSKEKDKKEKQTFDKLGKVSPFRALTLTPKKI
jgi:hypothetical protein